MIEKPVYDDKGNKTGTKAALKNHVEAVSNTVSSAYTPSLSDDHHHFIH